MRPASNIRPFGILSALFSQIRDRFYGHGDLGVSWEGVIVYENAHFYEEYQCFFARSRRMFNGLALLSSICPTTQRTSPFQGCPVLKFPLGPDLACQREA